MSTPCVVEPKKMAKEPEKIMKCVADLQKNPTNFTYQENENKKISDTENNQT